MKLLHANDFAGKHAPSWYHATCNAPTYPELTEDITCDVCVIGAGYTGLSTAIHLIKQGLSVAVLDAHRVAWGASGRNGGLLGSGFNLDQIELERQYGVAHAHALWQLSERAKRTVHHLCKAHKIDAQYKPGIVAAMHRPKLFGYEQRYCDMMVSKYNYRHYEILSKARLRDLVDSPNYYGGRIDHGAGHIHPLELGIGLGKAASELGASVFEMSAVVAIDRKPRKDHVVRTTKASVRATNIVLACNGYLDGLDPAVQKRVMPINNFMIATEPLGARGERLLPQDNAVFDSRFVVNYFRLSSSKRLLFGGGENYGYRFPKDITAMVKKPLLEVFPQLHDVRIDYAWGGTLAITRSRLPMVRKVKQRVYSASGYSGHGVALSIEAGRVIAKAISGDKTDLDVLNKLVCRRFPGGYSTRSLLLKGAMSWYALQDKL